jgi:hypothetical protein
MPTYLRHALVFFVSVDSNIMNLIEKMARKQIDFVQRAAEICFLTVSEIKQLTYLKPILNDGFSK